MSDDTIATVEVDVDLDGSTEYPAAYRSVTYTLLPPRHWSDEDVRRRAASFAGVPLEQVGEVRRP